MSKLLNTLKVLQLQTFFASKGIEKASQFIPVLNELHRRPFTSSSSGYDDNSFSDEFRDKHQGKQWPSEGLDVLRDKDDFYGSHRRHHHRSFRNEEPHFRGHGFRDRFEKKSLGSRLKAHEWTATELGSFEKNFYISHPSVSERSQEDIDDFYHKHNVSVTRGEKPRPICHFQEANFPDLINHRLTATGWVEPTPIQSIGWPLALSGKNLVGIAQTGSGKTLGFILPALVHIRHQRPVEKGGEPIVLVLAPTRELAQQIQGVSHQFSRPLGIRSSCIFGGQSKIVQARQLLKGQEIMVATPGRLIDFLEDDLINLGRTTYVVLDEADRMLDMGFEPQIRKILSQIRPDRQMLMWTATWPEEIQSLAHDFLGDFTQVIIGSSELTVNSNIEQIFRICDEREKFRRLSNELRSIFEKSEDPRQEKILVFANTQLKTEMISRKLRYERISAREIHGRKSQTYRDSTLESFRSGRLNVLVATDVAARGLDVDDIKVVVNYDLPTSIDGYIHRIGRTARASKRGIAISFCTEDSNILPDIISTLKASDKEVDHELKQLATLQSKYGKKGRRNSWSQYGERRGFSAHYQRRDAGKFTPRYTGKRSYPERYQSGGSDRQDGDWKGKNLLF